MPEQPEDARPAKIRVLDAYEAIVLGDGDRAATLDAVAARAGVSKGGLLYHFPGRGALATAEIERLDALVDEDIVAMRADEDGVVEYLLRTSTETDTALDRAIIAVSRLARVPDQAAVDALARMRERWVETVAEATKDRDAAVVIALAAEGLYQLAAEAEDGAARDALVAPVLASLRAALPRLTA